MSEVSLFDLIDAFRTALNRYKQNHPQSLQLQHTRHKISEKMAELYAKVKEKSPIRLQWFLEGRDRHELIAIFLATLELAASACSRATRSATSSSERPTPKLMKRSLQCSTRADSRYGND